jgi:hypothetical protein
MMQLRNSARLVNVSRLWETNIYCTSDGRLLLLPVPGVPGTSCPSRISAGSRFLAKSATWLPLNPSNIPYRQRSYSSTRNRNDLQFATEWRRKIMDHWEPPFVFLIPVPVSYLCVRPYLAVWRQRSDGEALGRLPVLLVVGPDPAVVSFYSLAASHPSSFICFEPAFEYFWIPTLLYLVR